LLCEYEDSEDNVVSLNLLFEGVEAFKCTYYNACAVEIVKLAYDKIVDVGSTEWLNAIKSQLLKSHEDVTGLRHLVIYFDDGPCYEFICRSFQAEEQRLSKE